MVNDEEQAKFYCNKFNLKNFRIFKENLVAVTLIKKTINWNKPTYLGAAILDISKLQVYKIYYERIVPQYGTNARVMYKDRDSSFYEIKTGDVYKDLVKFRDIMDFSSYPTDHFLFDVSNRKIPLKLSDELSGCIV